MFTSITFRKRRRKMRDGRTVILKRFVLSWRDPRSRKRKQQFYKTRADAEAARTKLLEAVATGAAPPSRSSLTVQEAVDYWLDAKRPEVRADTLKGYRLYVNHAAALFPIRVSELTTADIRRWHSAVPSRRTAAKAKSFLASALALAAEDFGVRPPPMPTIRTNGPRIRKEVLTIEQVGQLLAFCRNQPRGLLVALPFLTGLRAGEILGLLWECIDLEAGLIRVVRSQALDGALNETKTAAGVRIVPIGAHLRAWLSKWESRRPTTHGQARVFTNKQGGPMPYASFHRRVWGPIIKQAGVPYVSPHSARHFYISCLQQVGAAVPTASRLAGHSDVRVTLSVYSHSLGDGREHVEALERGLIG